ncbi:MAG: TIGR03905 family TSCPD domain-containing protein [Lachnospiraceae bacterium]|nr:TIGR03905 family TSCPD domain-containing protein [Lachnospiraceae bacterium]
MTKEMDFRPKGVCSQNIHIELDDEGVVKEIRFLGGCSGNTQGVSALAIGRPAKEVAESLRGIRCGFKDTSCPDQLAEALEQMLAE